MLGRRDRYSKVRTARRFTIFDELLDYDYDDQRWRFLEQDQDQDQQKEHHRSKTNATGVIGFCLFGGAPGHTTIAIVTAILIGLFIELRFHDAWSLHIW